MSPKEFVRDYITPAGGRFQRATGDHHVYVFEDGRTFHLPVGGKKNEMKSWMVSKFRSFLKAGVAGRAPAR